MALSRTQKESAVAELKDQLSSSKMTVFASYQGLSVEDMQNLRNGAKESAVAVKVAKNRLVKLAASQTDNLKSSDLSDLSGQLVYAFGETDEVAPAQVLAKFAKTHPSLQLAGAIAADGKLLGETEVKALSTLPSKNELIATVMNTLSSPLNSTLGALAGDLHGLLDGVASKATA